LAFLQRYGSGCRLSQEVVGYGKRRVSAITGHRHEYDHTETYQPQDGMRVMSVSFRPTGGPG
jgi:hypothetical protein